MNKSRKNFMDDTIGIQSTSKRGLNLSFAYQNENFLHWIHPAKRQLR